MSGGLAVSKSTVYIANLDYSLTNNDIHQLFSPHGKIAKVTIVRDTETHQSKGLAFILFKTVHDAQACVAAMNGAQLSGRTIKCSIAVDNGRAAEFIRRKEYKDKSRCYECGSEGHLSYECPKNQLGARPRPSADKAREKKRRRREREDAVKHPRPAPSAGSGSEGGQSDDDVGIGIATLAAGARPPAPLRQAAPSRPPPPARRPPAGRGGGQAPEEEAWDDEEESWGGQRPVPEAPPPSAAARNPVARPHARQRGYFSDEDEGG